MTQATIDIPVLQPHDLDGVTILIDTSGPNPVIRAIPYSADGGNVLVKGSDGKALLTPAGVQAAQSRYALAIDSTKKIIQLMRSDNGAAPVVDTSVNTAVFDVSVTGATIDNNGNLILQESNGGGTVTVSLSSYLTTVAFLASQSTTVSGAGTAANPLEINLKVDATVAGNLVKISANGVKVDPADVVALINNSIQVTTTVDTTNNVFSTKVGNQTSSNPIVYLTGLDGTVIGAIFKTS